MMAKPSIPTYYNLKLLPYGMNIFSNNLSNLSQAKDCFHCRLIQYAPSRGTLRISKISNIFSCTYSFITSTSAKAVQSFYRETGKKVFLKQYQIYLPYRQNGRVRIIWHFLFQFFFFLASAFQSLRPRVVLCVALPTSRDASGCDSLCRDNSALLPEEKPKV